MALAWGNVFAIYYSFLNVRGAFAPLTHTPICTNEREAAQKETTWKRDRKDIINELDKNETKIKLAVKTKKLFRC